MEALPVTVRQLRVETSTNKILSMVIHFTKGSWPHVVQASLHPFFCQLIELSVEEGCLLWGYRVVIPQRKRAKLRLELHQDHPGVTQMKSVAQSYIQCMVARSGQGDRKLIEILFSLSSSEMRSTCSPIAAPVLRLYTWFGCKNMCNGLTGAKGVMHQI